MTRNWGRAADPTELPVLRYCSDIYWAHWIRDNPNIRNLRVYGAQNVVNDDTVLMTVGAMKITELHDLSPWPGTSFDASSPEGKALIGKLNLSRQISAIGV